MLFLRFSRVPVNKTLHEGYTAQFKCTSHDSNVVWSKDGGPLPLKAGYQNQGSIYIPEVKLEDSGFYECSVNNTSGVVTAKAYLYVQGLLQLYNSSVECKPVSISQIYCYNIK